MKCSLPYHQQNFIDAFFLKNDGQIFIFIKNYKKKKFLTIIQIVF